MSKRSTKEVTASKIAEMQRLVNGGMDRVDVAAKLHVAPSTVYKYAPVKRADNASKMLVAVDLIDPGMSRNEIMAAYEPIGIAAGYMDRSLKDHILLTLVQRGPFKGVQELADAMRGSGPRNNYGVHEIATLLHALSKRGMVRFRQSKNVPGVADMMLTNITATDAAHQKLGIQGRVAPPIEGRTGNHPPGYSRQRHAAGKDLTEPRYHAGVATGGPVEVTVAKVRPATMGEVIHGSPPYVPDEPTPSQTVQEPTAVPASTPAQPEPASRQDGPRWPLLVKLQAEYERVQKVSDQASKLMEAAETLADIDPEAAQQLLDRADKLVGPAFTPLEAEYLRFAGSLRDRDK